MKVRDSGMPERFFWESLFDVPLVLDRLSIGAAMRDVVEIGCGYGTFTIPVAQRISGTLHTFDIESDMVAMTQSRLRDAGVGNVRVSHRDVISSGYGLAPSTVDAVLLFNILHTENPVEMLRTAAEVLSPSGRVLVIHWRSDIPTPRGPDLSIRPRPDQILAWAGKTGRLVAEAEQLDLPPWHFGLSLTLT